MSGQRFGSYCYIWFIQQIVEDKRKEKENDVEGKVEEITESPKIYNINAISIFWQNFVKLKILH